MKAGSVVALKSAPAILMTVRSVTPARPDWCLTVWFDSATTLKTGDFRQAELIVITE